MSREHPRHRCVLHMLVFTGLCALMTTSWSAPQTILLTNDSGKPIPNAAISVYVKGVRAQTSAGTSAELAQKDKAFIPTLLVIQTGTLVSFPNFDTVRHHVYSFSATKPFEIKLYAGTPAKPVLFDKAGTATLGCNIHDRMLAYIHVVDTPYFGLTDANGQITLDIPSGEHGVRAWTPNLGEKQPGNEHVLKTGAGIVTIRSKL